MNYLPFFTLLFLVFLSCGDATSEENISQEVVVDTSVYGKTHFEVPKLIPQANALVDNWPIFQDFRGEALTLKNIKLEDLKIKSEKLLAHTDSLSKNIPDTLYSNAIQSRLTIVKTRIHLLKQEVNRGKTRPEEIENNLVEAQKAIETFVIQINEKVLKDKIDFQRKEGEQKELEKQKKARDSIFKLELEDQ